MKAAGGKSERYSGLKLTELVWMDWCGKIVVPPRQLLQMARSGQVRPCSILLIHGTSLLIGWGIISSAVMRFAAKKWRNGGKIRKVYSWLKWSLLLILLLKITIGCRIPKTTLVKTEQKPRFADLGCIRKGRWWDTSEWFMEIKGKMLDLRQIEDLRHCIV